MGEASLFLTQIEILAEVVNNHKRACADLVLAATGCGQEPEQLVKLQENLLQIQKDQGELTEKAKEVRKKPWAAFGEQCEFEDSKVEMLMEEMANAFEQINTIEKQLKIAGEKLEEAEAILKKIVEESQ
jgi:seryl-tRNA synthetase